MLFLIGMAFLVFWGLLLAAAKSNGDKKRKAKERMTEQTGRIIDSQKIRPVPQNTTTVKSHKKAHRSPEDIAGFYGTEVRSPDGHYILVFADSYTDNGRTIKGKVALIRDQSLQFKKSVQRPMEAVVSTTGIVVCCDATSLDELAGKFYCWDAEGNVLFSRTTSANLGTCAISSDSAIAVFDTYGSPTEDANCLFIVDIGQKAIMHQFERPYPYTTIQINTADRTLLLTDAYGFKFICNFEGEQINREAFEQQILTQGTVVQKLGFFEEKPMQEKSKDQRYLNWLKAALTNEEALHVFGKAWIYRRMGEWYEAADDAPNAIGSWEKALAINPKIGIKRKMEDLKKQGRSAGNE